MKEIETEVIEAENALLGALKSGDLEKGVAMHLNSPEYRNIWSGEMKTHDQLEATIAKAKEKGLSSIDYQVTDREFLVVNDENVLTTLTATETTHMNTGEEKTSGKTIISILWQKIEGEWKLGYLHASEEPQGDTNPVWKNE